MKHLLLCVALALPALAFAQGALTPPGAPAPTMKSLDQVEPRTPLVAGASGVTANGNGGFSIMAPGSYYLTGNLAVSSGDGILIYCHNVTLDLNGFMISSTATPASGTAIWMTATNHNVTIRNGHIYGAIVVPASGTGTPTGSGFNDGIICYDAQSLCRVSDISIRGVANNGIYFLTPTRSSVERCAVESCGAIGIRADSVRSSSANACGSYGILATLVTDSYGATYSSGARGVTAAGTATNCRAANTANGGIALWAAIAIGCTVEQGSVVATNRYLMP